MGNANAADDSRRYREGYPGQVDDPTRNVNLRFYKNELRSRPDGDYIDDIHRRWFGNYGLLEAHHGYIQWLFPIREEGMNSEAERLQLHEAKAIAADPALQARVIKSYELMLDFYGMKLVDRTTGEIARSDGWRPRYQHLNRSYHNYLRITRILKCLGEVGLEHYKMPFVRHVINEIGQHNELRNCLESCAKYWLSVLKSDDERQAMLDLVTPLVAPQQSASSSSYSGSRRTRLDLSDDDDDDSDGDRPQSKGSKAPAPAEPASPAGGSKTPASNDSEDDSRDGDSPPVGNASAGPPQSHD